MNDCPLRRPLGDPGDRRAAAACSLLAPNAARRSLSSGSGRAALIKRGGPPCRETSRLEAYVIRKSDGFKLNYRFLRRGREVNTTALMALILESQKWSVDHEKKGWWRLGSWGWACLRPRRSSIARPCPFMCSCRSRSFKARRNAVDPPPTARSLPAFDQHDEPSGSGPPIDPRQTALRGGVTTLRFATGLPLAVWMRHDNRHPCHCRAHRSCRASRETPTRSGPHQRCVVKLRRECLAFGRRLWDGRTDPALRLLTVRRLSSRCRAGRSQISSERHR